MCLYVCIRHMLSAWPVRLSVLTRTSVCVRAICTLFRHVCLYVCRRVCTYSCLAAFPDNMCVYSAGQTAHSEVSKERSVKEEAVARASKAERELDQARARAAVLDNKLVVSPSVVSVGRYVNR